jgi:hypothetical protein
MTYFLMVPYYPADTPLMGQAGIYPSATRALNAGENWIMRKRREELNDHEPGEPRQWIEHDPLRWILGDHFIKAEVYQLVFHEEWIPLESEEGR